MAKKTPSKKTTAPAADKPAKPAADPSASEPAAKAAAPAKPARPVFQAPPKPHGGDFPGKGGKGPKPLKGRIFRHQGR